MLDETTTVNPIETISRERAIQRYEDAMQDFRMAKAALYQANREMIQARAELADQLNISAYWLK